MVDGHEPVGRVMEPAVRQAVLRLVCHQLSQAGFTHVDDPAVLDDLESLAHSRACAAHAHKMHSF